MKFFIYTFILLFSSQSFALSLSGFPVQGGFIMGKTIAGAEVSLDDEHVIADENGRFVIGISRLQNEKSHLVVKLLGEVLETQPLNIAQNSYKTQYIKGVKNKHVNPKSEEDLKQIASDSASINASRAIFEPLPFIEGDFIQPIEGPMTGVYGSRRFYNNEERNWHKGADFAAKTGTPVVAPANGVVRLALANSFFNGNLIILDHGFQMMTIYAHLDTMRVKVGQHVSQGDIIGTVGTTGRSTGPHLHWGLYFKNMALNPMLLLEEKQTLR